MALFGLIPDENSAPYNSQQIDAGTAGLIQSQADRALSGQSSNADAARSADESVAAWGQKPTGLTGQSGMGQAIASKYGSIGQQEIEKMKRIQSLQGAEMDFKRTGLAFNSINQRLQMEIGNRQRIEQARKNEQATRQAAINSIFGMAGMGVGMAMGGPAGAMAGQKIGSGMSGMGQPQANSFQSNLGNGNYNLGSEGY